MRMKSYNYDIHETPFVKERKCTDVIFLIIFLVFILSFGGLVFWNFKYAPVIGGGVGVKIKRLINGVDYMGNICGEGKNYNKPYLFFPIIIYNNLTYSEIKASIIFSECVSNCVKTYELTQNDVKGPKSKYLILQHPSLEYKGYPTILFLNKICLLDVSKIDKFKIIDIDFYKILNNLFKNSLLFFRDIYGLIIFFIGSILISYAYIFAMYFFTQIIIWVTIIGMLAGFISAGIYLIYFIKIPSIFIKYGITWLTNLTYVTGIICFIIAGIYVLILIWAFKKIKFAIKVQKETCKAVLSIRFLYLVPITFTIIITAIFLLMMFILFLFVQIRFERYDQRFPQLIINSNIFEGKETYSYYSPGIYGYMILIATLFMFFWFVEFFKYFQLRLISGSTTKWYFTKINGRKKFMTFSTLWKTLKLVLLHHLGSLFFGSLLIAIIAVIRKIISIFSIIKFSTANNKFTRCLLVCINCIIKFIDEVLRKFTEFALAIVVLKGYSFLKAGKYGIKLISNNKSRYIFSRILDNIFIFLSNLFITSIVVFCYILYYKKEPLYFIYFLIGLMSYINTSFILKIYDDGSTGILLSILAEMDINKDNPKYTPNNKIGKLIANNEN